MSQIVVDEEMILMQETRLTYFSLNLIGAKIWSLFDIGARTLIELADYLQKEYQLEEQRSMQDARQFVELLVANELVYLKDMDGRKDSAC